AADVALDLHRGEGMLAATLAAHGKDLAGQLRTEVQLALLQHVRQVEQRVLVHFQKVGDARCAAQALEHFLADLGLVDLAFHFQVVPHAAHLQLRIQVAQHGTDVLPQLPQELLTHRPAFDGDLGEGFDDELHGKVARAVPKKGGADYSGNRSRADQKSVTIN